jgi:UDP-N-acetyl-D-mannosaminuronate dehydrogenase
MSIKTLVVGLGEVGGPLLEIIRSSQEAYGIDINPPESVPQCDIMHICFPYVDGEKFIAEAVRYIGKYRPLLTIIDSTVGPGTTRAVAEKSGADVVYSPVRGKHAKMKQDMLHYVKFVGALNPAAGQKACAHFESIGMKSRLVSTPEAAELAKLTETTYFGVLIAWAQEVERYCKEFGASYDEVTAFYEEIRFFPPVKYFPGVIGGHCVIPNIKILKTTFDSQLLKAIEASNELKLASQ